MAIIVHSSAGMGDRLFTLNQFQQFKESTGIDYVFLFNTQLENCDNFQEYFHIDDKLNVQIRNVDNSQIGDIIKNRKFENWNISDDLNICLANYDIPQNIANIEYLESHNIYISCAKGVGNLPQTQNFWSGTFLDNHVFPSDKIREKTVDYMSKCDWNDNMPIGMHIRRTDHRYCIEKSPDHLFYSKIEELIQKDPSTRIFLCTDDPILKQDILEKYGTDKIITRKVKPRRTPGGFEDAVVDMFLLSKCKELYACIKSGFIELASRIGHIKITRLHI